MMKVRVKAKLFIQCPLVERATSCVFVKTSVTTLRASQMSFACITVFVSIYRCQLYVKRYLKSATQLLATASLSLPVVNFSEHKLSQLSKHKLYVRFRRHPCYCLVSIVEIHTGDCHTGHCPLSLIFETFRVD